MLPFHFFGKTSAKYLPKTAPQAKIRDALAHKRIPHHYLIIYYYLSAFSMCVVPVV